MRVLVLLIVPLLAGCTANPDSPLDKFQGADFRFSGSSLESFEFDDRIDLPAGAHTLMISVRSENGFGISFDGPGQGGNGFSLFNEVHIRDLRYITWEQPEGTWQLEFGCDGRCVYTIAVDIGDTIPDTPLRATPTTFGAEAEFTGQKTFSFEVAGDLSNATILFDHFGEDIEFKLFDPNGKQAGHWRFQHVRAEGFEYQSRSDGLAAGEWVVQATCGGTCWLHAGVNP